MSNKHVALHHAQRQLIVTPLKPHTKAAYKHDWPSLRWTAEQVEQHWNSFGNDLVGILTGEVNGFFVLDKDAGSIAELEAAFGPLPETLVVQSGGDGDRRHYYFKWPGFRVGNLGSARNRPFDGWETKGDGGQVVAPGCTHPKTGRVYGVMDAPDDDPVTLDTSLIADAPGWLIDHLKAWADAQEGFEQYDGDVAEHPDISPDQDHAIFVFEMLEESIPRPTMGSGGDLALYHVCCEIARCGIAPDAAMTILQQYDQKFCVPSWSSTGEAKRVFPHKLRCAYRECATKGEIGRHLSDPDDSVDLSAGFGGAPAATAALAQTNGAPDHPEEILGASTKYVPFPLDVLPSTLREYCESVATARAIYPGVVAAALIPALGSRIGTSRAGRDREYLSPATFWVAVIQRSGAGKSGAIKSATRFMRDANARYLRDWEDEKQRVSDFNDQKDKDEKKQTAPKESERCLVGDITTARLLDILCANPRGLLVYNDELAKLLAGMDQFKAKGGNDMEIYLELHDLSSVQRDLKGGGDGPTVVHTPETTVSVVGGIQPGRFRELMDTKASASGFLQRWLPIRPPDSTDQMIDASAESSVPDHLTAAVARIFIQLEGLQPDQEFGKARAAPVHFSDDALPIWVEYWKHWRKQANRAPDDLAAAFQDKFVGHTHRFALLLTLLDEAERASDEGFGDSSASTMQAVEIQPGHVHRAVKLANWWRNEAERCLDFLHKSKEQSGAEYVVALANKKEQLTFTARDLHKWNTREYPKMADAKLAMKSVVEAGLGVRVTENVKKNQHVLTVLKCL